MNAPVPLRFVLLCSPSYSGSTLLGFLMNAHPQIVSMGEMFGLIESVNPNTYLCSCGERLVDCAFWSDVETIMQQQGYPFSVTDFDTRIEWGQNALLRRLRSKSLRNPHLEQWRDRILTLWPPYRTKLQYYVERNAALARALSMVSGKPVVFDTSKDRMRIRHLLRSKALDLRAVHLVRDVRGVVYSNVRHRKLSDVTEPTLFWQRFNQLMEQEMRMLPASNAGITIRYEDLCTDTKKTLNRLYEFCGVDSIDELNLQGADHHILGNQMRLQKLDTVTLDERWKTALTPVQIQTIDRLSVSMRAVYHYSDAELG